MTDERLDEIEERCAVLVQHFPYDGKLLYEAVIEIHRLRGLVLGYADQLSDIEAAVTAITEPGDDIPYAQLRRELAI